MANPSRSRVEVLKFLDPRTIITGCSLVSRDWRVTVDFAELWNSIISDIHGDEVILDTYQQGAGRLAFKTYLDTHHSVFIFNDEDRLLEDVRREEALKKNEEYSRSQTELKTVRLPRMNKTLAKLPPDYIHAFHSTYVWVPPSHLFVTGGRVVDDKERLTSPTYLVNLQNFSVERLEETTLINSPSLVHYQQVVYSFGGSVFPEKEPAKCISQAQKFVMSALRWLPLKGGEMPNPHCYGWAERFDNTKIFIIGGFGSSGAVDVFDIPSETFRTLAVSLSSQSEALIGIRDGDTLHCLSGQKALTVRLSDWATDTVSDVREAQLTSDNVWMWASPVVVLQNKAYFVLFDTVVYTYELDTKKFEFEKNEGS